MPIFNKTIIKNMNYQLSEINSKCKQRLNQIFPKGIPDEVQIRYEIEIRYMKQSKMADDFWIYHNISKVANAISNVVNVRPTISGSILCYLLGNSYNPLSPYYYCSECGYYERIEGICYGVDAPQKQCPTCGKLLDGEGYNIPIESVWGLDGTKNIAIEYEVELDFVRTIKRILEMYYTDCIVAYWSDGMLEDTTNGGDTRIIDGYVILPKEFEVEECSKVRVQKINGKTHIQGDWSVVEECMIKYVRIFVNVNQNESNEYVKDNGLYSYQDDKVPEFFWNAVYHTTPEFRDDFLSMLQEFESQTFEEIVAACSSVYNSYAWDTQDNQAFDLEKLKWFLLSDEFRKCPCLTREDFYEYLCKLGMKRTEAFKVAELIRKGIAAIQPNRLLTHELPKEVLDVAKDYRYVVSRAYAAQTVYHSWIKRK